MNANFRKSILAVTLILPIAIIHNGCVMYTSRECQSQCEYRNPGLMKKNICYQFKRTSRWNGIGFDRDNCSEVVRGSVALAQDTGVALKQFQDEFSDVAASLHGEAGNSDNHEIMMNIQLQNSWNKSTLPFAFISGASLTVIPCWVEEAYTLYVEANETRRKISRTYELTSSVNQIIWLPCVFAVPFNDKPEAYIDKITKGHWHELKMRMYADGFFERNEL